MLVSPVSFNEKLGSLTKTSRERISFQIPHFTYIISGICIYLVISFEFIWNEKQWKSIFVHNNYLKIRKQPKIILILPAITIKFGIVSVFFVKAWVFLCLYLLTSFTHFAHPPSPSPLATTGLFYVLRSLFLFVLLF